MVSILFADGLELAFALQQLWGHLYLGKCYFTFQVKINNHNKSIIIYNNTKMGVVKLIVMFL